MRKKGEEEKTGSKKRKRISIKRKKRKARSKSKRREGRCGRFKIHSLNHKSSLVRLPRASFVHLFVL